MKIYEGQITAGELKIAIVVARFNELITEKLLQGALDAWRRAGGEGSTPGGSTPGGSTPGGSTPGGSTPVVAHVPGAFELPLAAQTLAQTKKFDAIVCLGCVIRGATDHYDYVCGQTASGIMKAGLDANIPVIFGVLTTDTLEQAFERAGSKAGNKGVEAMLAAMEMANLQLQIRHSSD